MREAAVLLFLGPEAQDISQIVTAMFALSITIFILNLLLPLALTLININTVQSKTRAVADNTQINGEGLSTVLSLTCAMSVPFLALIQLEGVIATTKLTISPGDLFAIWTLVSIYPVLLWSFISDRRSSSKVPVDVLNADAVNRVVPILAVTILYFLLSAFLSLYFVGYNSYSFVSRFSGLFVLLGCFFSGYILGQLDKKLLKFAVCCFATILAIQLLIPVLAISLDFRQLIFFVTDHVFRFFGFQNNPNAFGFSVLMIVNLYIVVQRKVAFSNHVHVTLMTIFVVSIMLSGSRAIALASLPLIVIAVYEMKGNTATRIVLGLLYCLILTK
ncbi:MAG: hypothetical protein ACR2PH_03010, partial [Desulfobulbia bacterium]